MRKNITNKLLCILIAVSCMITSISLAKLETPAQIKDVTKSVSGKQDIKELTQIFTTFCGYNLTELMKKGRTKEYDFSKSSNRRTVLNLCYQEMQGKGIGERALSIRMFGRSTSNIDLLIGDWGCSWPEIKIVKIYKTSSNKYKVTANVNWFEEEKNKSKKIGSLRLYLKKDSNSYYGYIAESMKLVKVADI